MRSRFILPFVIMATSLLLSAGYIMITDHSYTPFSEERAMVVMRDIGHRILLHAGDSTSRILPVKKLNNNIFQIEFQTKFTFIPDTLVKTVHSTLASGDLPLQYLVNVRDCENDQIVYGYEIGVQKYTIVPCLGRDQPVACYRIQITFIDDERAEASMGYFTGVISLFGLVIFVFAGGVHLLKKRDPVKTEGAGIAIGKFILHADTGKLNYGNETIVLSDKEFRILKIFASGLNQPIDRERLLKEVWEDEGVIVGRSLDVFVSKLRKKLQADPSVKIVTIHGKGYKLEVD